jgi:hypothetical protein
VRAPLETFAGLLDLSVQEIAIIAADGRAFDTYRIGRLADIWDNNTFPLVSAACAARPVRAARARTGLMWMAALGNSRRALIVSLDAALDRDLPAAVPEPSVHRDYQARVRPGSFPVTRQIVADLAVDYDLADASVRSIAVRPAESGLHVDMTLAAPRRFIPSYGRVARDGSRKPWPAAPLHLTLAGVTDLQFGATDRLGISICDGDGGIAVRIGQNGTVQAANASVWPDDPMWHESAAGRAADTVTPHKQPDRRQVVHTSSLTAQQRAAARALTNLMLQIRLVSYYPALAATIPVRAMCGLAAGAGSAILAASAERGSAREESLAKLAQRWQLVPPKLPPAPIPSGPATVRYVRYMEPNEDYEVHHEGSAVLVAAVPDTDPAAPWALASEELAQPADFRITTAAFGGIREARRDADALALNKGLSIQQTP